MIGDVAQEWRNRLPSGALSAPYAADEWQPSNDQQGDSGEQTVNLHKEVSHEQYTALVRLSEWKYANEPATAPVHEQDKWLAEFAIAQSLVPSRCVADARLAHYRPVYRGNQPVPCAVWVEWRHVWHEKKTTRFPWAQREYRIAGVLRIRVTGVRA